MKKLVSIILCAALLLTLTSCVTVKVGDSTNYDKYDNSAKYTIGNFDYNASGVKKIVINWVGGKIDLVESHESVLSVSENATTLTDGEKMRYFLDGDTLRIHYCESGHIGLIDETQKYLTVSVPENVDIRINAVSSDVSATELNLESFDVNIVSGNVTIDSVTTNEFDVNSVSGDLSVGALSADKIDAESVSGNIELNSVVADKIKTYSVSGKVSATVSSATSIDSETVSGNIKLNFEGIGASVSYKTVSGDLSCDGATVSGKSYVFGNGKVTVSAKTVSGDLTVTYKD